VNERAQLLLSLADDELILGWRNSEWTGIAPFLEEDVAFSSIAQNEIGHARALYELAARELGTDADALAFDRPLEEYRSAPLVELSRLEWARTIARHWLYETADAIRLDALEGSDDEELAGSPRRSTARRCTTGSTRRCGSTGSSAPTRVADASTRRSTSSGRTRSASWTTRCVPSSCGASRRSSARHAGRRAHRARAPRGRAAELHEEMTMVRRSAPAGARW
jgi:hypothetical protein